jgi:hypothetical protein
LHWQPYRTAFRAAGIIAEVKMSRRKGELSNWRIDHDWPHQVAILRELCCMDNLEVVQKFSSARSCSPRNRSVTIIWADRKPEIHSVYCFSDPAHAQEFINEFGGYHFDPVKDRAKGRKDTWFRSEPWQLILESGPLSVPQMLRD